MSPKKNPQESSPKRLKMSLQIKSEIIAKRERGVSVANLARLYNRSASTICTILKNKDKIKEVDASKGVTRISTQRIAILDDIERLLLIWINEMQLQGGSISEKDICEKAKMIYTDLIMKTPGSSEEEGQFKASRGWFEKFRRRTGIHSIVKQGEAASSAIKAAETFIFDFKNYIDSESYVPQQVFNCDETMLFWKKMPKRTYITEEENTLHGPKPMKDYLTLLLCANASGDLKIKPLLVYHSEAPRAFKKCKVQKSKLNIMWRSNKKARVTPAIFADWINQVFGPSVKKYLHKLNLPLHVLLVMDNAAAHTPSLQNAIFKEYDFIKIHFLPPNTTRILQPMGQQVVSNFKKLYIKTLFECCLEVTEGSNLTLREFWKTHFHIVTCLKIINEAWDGVLKTTLTSAWKKLWPESAVESDEGFEAVVVSEDPIISEIVSLSNTLGLEVDSNDINELVAEHSQELTTEELMELSWISQQEVVQETLSGEDDVTINQSSLDDTREILQAWETVASYIEKHHPNKAVAMRSKELFKNNVMSHFYKISKRPQKNTCL